MKEFRVSGTFEIKVEAKDSEEAVEEALIKASFEPYEYLEIDTIICEKDEARADLIRKYEIPSELEAQENFCN